jgi:hypothetical protein
VQCINQKDDEEKSDQVPIMGQIYSRASNVCIWLGKEDQTSSLAFKHINLVLKLQIFEQTVHEEYAEAWAALSDLMKRDWFSRRWVVQEIAFARKATVHCGKKKIDWTELADAVALFGSRADEISNLFKGHRKYNHRTDYLGDVQASGASRLVGTISMLFRKADDGEHISKLMTLESLVSRLSAFKATVAHDIIYAVLSLASDTITSASPMHFAVNVEPSHDAGPLSRRYDGAHAPGLSRDPNALSPQPDRAAQNSLATRRSSDVSSSGKEAVFAHVRRSSTPGPIPDPSVGLGSTGLAPWRGHPLGHQLVEALPENEAEARESVMELGFSKEAIEAAIRTINTYKPWILKEMPNGEVEDKAKASLQLRDEDRLPKDFWNPQTRAALRAGNGSVVVALKYLWQRNEDPRIDQAMQKRITAKSFMDKLQNRVTAKTFHVNYKTKNFYEVCKEFIKFVIRQSESLDMLFRPWAPVKEDLNDDTDLPSWICRLDKSPLRPRPDGNFGRVNADLLVGLPESGSRTYSASATTKPTKAAFSETGRSLYVEGMVLDHIGELKVPAGEGNVPNEWLELGGWHTMKEEPPESFWRTLVGDRDHKGHNPPWYYRRACQYAFAQRVTGGALNTDRLMSSESSKIVTDYLKRVQAVVFNRRLIKTRDVPRLGLVPDTAKEGDKICILRGCSVPVVLREMTDDHDSGRRRSTRSSDSKAAIDRSTVNGAGQDAGSPRLEKIPELKNDEDMKCKVVGECYIHGVMDGEAFRIRDRDKLPAVKFELI